MALQIPPAPLTRPLSRGRSESSAVASPRLRPQAPLAPGRDTATTAYDRSMSPGESTALANTATDASHTLQPTSPRPIPPRVDVAKSAAQTAVDTPNGAPTANERTLDISDEPLFPTETLRPTATSQHAGGTRELFLDNNEHNKTPLSPLRRASLHAAPTAQESRSPTKAPTASCTLVSWATLYEADADVAQAPTTVPVVLRVPSRSCSSTPYDDSGASAAVQLPTWEEVRIPASRTASRAASPVSAPSCCYVGPHSYGGDRPAVEEVGREYPPTYLQLPVYDVLRTAPTSAAGTGSSHHLYGPPPLSPFLPSPTVAALHAATPTSRSQSPTGSLYTTEDLFPTQVRRSVSPFSRTDIMVNSAPLQHPAAGSKLPLAPLTVHRVSQEVQVRPAPYSKPQSSVHIHDTSYAGGVQLSSYNTSVEDPRPSSSAGGVDATSTSSASLGVQQPTWDRPRQLRQPICTPSNRISTDRFLDSVTTSVLNTTGSGSASESVSLLKGSAWAACSEVVTRSSPQQQPLKPPRGNLHATEEDDDVTIDVVMNLTDASPPKKLSGVPDVVVTESAPPVAATVLEEDDNIEMEVALAPPKNTSTTEGIGAPAAEPSATCNSNEAEQQKSLSPSRQSVASFLTVCSQQAQSARALSAECVDALLVPKRGMSQELCAAMCNVVPMAAEERRALQRNEGAATLPSATHISAPCLASPLPSAMSCWEELAAARGKSCSAERDAALLACQRDRVAAEARLIEAQLRSIDDRMNAAVLVHSTVAPANTTSPPPQRQVSPSPTNPANYFYRQRALIAANADAREQLQNRRSEQGAMLSVPRSASEARRPVHTLQQLFAVAASSSSKQRQSQSRGSTALERLAVEATPGDAGPLFQTSGLSPSPRGPTTASQTHVGLTAGKENMFQGKGRAEEKSLIPFSLRRSLALSTANETSPHSSSSTTVSSCAISASSSGTTASTALSASTSQKSHSGAFEDECKSLRPYTRPLLSLLIRKDTSATGSVTAEDCESALGEVIAKHNVALGDLRMFMKHAFAHMALPGEFHDDKVPYASFVSTIVELAMNK